MKSVLCLASVFAQSWDAQPQPSAWDPAPAPWQAPAPASWQPAPAPWGQQGACYVSYKAPSQIHDRVPADGQYHMTSSDPLNHQFGSCCICNDAAANQYSCIAADRVTGCAHHSSWAPAPASWNPAPASWNPAPAPWSAMNNDHPRCVVDADSSVPQDGHYHMTNKHDNPCCKCVDPHSHNIDCIPANADGTGCLQISKASWGPAPAPSSWDAAPAPGPWGFMERRMEAESCKVKYACEGKDCYDTIPSDGNVYKVSSGHLADGTTCPKAACCQCDDGQAKCKCSDKDWC